jgi:hypothetical protein
MEAWTVALESYGMAAIISFVVAGLIVAINKAIQAGLAMKKH